MLTGWGRTAPTRADVVAPDTVEQLRTAVCGAGHTTGGSPGRGVTVRGLGRSYGDAAQNAGGLVVDLTRLDRLLDLDVETGMLTVEAGASLDQLMRRLLPAGWFVPVTPGTRYVTVGGAIGTDIHGKNHHVAGSITEHVHEMELLTAHGEVRTLHPEGPGSEEFWATAGGMGLTGVVTRARLDLIPVATSWMRVDTDRAGDLDALMALLSERDEEYRYSVAWIDATATGARTGRGVLTRGDHARLEDLPVRLRPRAREYAPRTLVTAPRRVPGHLLNRVSVRAFNEAWYRRHPAHRVGEIHGLSAFFHPLDAVAGWNSVYGQPGFVQYQFAVPFAAAETVRDAVNQLSMAGTPSFLAVLKRFGAANPGPLSFPRPGWTLALDIPADVPGLARLLDRLDEQVAAAGGSIYLAKDSRLRPELLPALYPRLDEWRTVRDRLDPQRVFTSDLARRLAL
ncbi:MAG: FAD-binding protein [Actinomycetes bacterium]